jgi:hypothetical protein
LFEWHASKSPAKASEDTPVQSEQLQRQDKQNKVSSWVNPKLQQRESIEAPTAFTTWVNPAITKAPPRTFASIPSTSKLFHPPSKYVNKAPIKGHVLKTAPIVKLPIKHEDEEVVAPAKAIVKPRKPIPKARGGFAALAMVASFFLVLSFSSG